MSLAQQMFNTNFGLVCVKEIFSEIKLLAGWIFGAWEEEKSFAREMRESFPCNRISRC